MPWKLLIRNVLGHKVRSLLTIGAVSVAVFLICMLHAVSSGLGRTLDSTSADRLLVMSAVSKSVNISTNSGGVSGGNHLRNPVGVSWVSR